VAKEEQLKYERNPALRYAQRRVALTLAYLNLACSDIAPRTMSELANSILSLVEGECRRPPRKKIGDPQVVELVWRHSQCVLNQTGRCPLLVFGQQMAEELNEFFAEDE
jgi:hypothetical protein